MERPSDTHRYTTLELCELMDRDPSWREFELDEGELIRVPPTGFLHGRVELRVGRLLDDYLRAHPIGVVVSGDVGFLLSADTVRGPDVAFVTRSRLEKSPPPEQGFYPGAPDLAVEVSSPD